MEALSLFPWAETVLTRSYQSAQRKRAKMRIMKILKNCGLVGNFVGVHVVHPLLNDLMPETMENCPRHQIGLAIRCNLLTFRHLEWYTSEIHAASLAGFFKLSCSAMRNLILCAERGDAHSWKVAVNAYNFTAGLQLWPTSEEEREAIFKTAQQNVKNGTSAYLPDWNTTLILVKDLSGFEVNTVYGCCMLRMFAARRMRAIHEAIMEEEGRFGYKAPDTIGCEIQHNQFDFQTTNNAVFEVYDKIREDAATRVGGHGKGQRFAIHQKGNTVLMGGGGVERDENGKVVEVYDSERGVWYPGDLLMESIDEWETWPHVISHHSAPLDRQARCRLAVAIVAGARSLSDAVKISRSPRKYANLLSSTSRNVDWSDIRVWFPADCEYELFLTFASFSILSPAIGFAQDSKCSCLVTSLQLGSSTRTNIRMDVAVYVKALKLFQKASRIFLTPRIEMIKQSADLYHAHLLPNICDLDHSSYCTVSDIWIGAKSLEGR